MSAKRRGYRPALIEMGGGTFEVHPCGRIYVRRARAGGRHTLERVKDKVVLRTIRGAMRREEAKRLSREKRLAQLKAAGSGERK